LPADLLRVPGPLWARRATDAVALLGVASLVTALFFGFVVVALFALVLFGLTLQRVAGLPGALQAATGLVLLLGAWASTLDWYVAVGWLDLAVHAAGNGLLAVVVVLVMVRAGLLTSTAARASQAGVAVVTLCVGVTLGVLWELGEWAGHTYLDDSIQVGYDDTVGDLAFGALGSLAAGVVLGRRAQDRSLRELLRA
jgi:hypothetical protein